MFCAAIRTLNQCFVVCSLATNRHKESVGLQLLSGIWIQVKTLVRIGWQSTLIRVDVVTILTARVCHLCTKSFKPFYIAIAFGGILIARLCKLRFLLRVVSITFIFCCACVVVNHYVSLYRVFREMWLKTIVLLRSLRIFAEFVNKLPWHHICQPVSRNFDRKTSLVSLNQVLEPEFDLSPRTSCCCRV